MTDQRRVVVLGGGVIGVTSAYFLARSGCQVTLIERNAETGLETSFANGGLITPSMSDPWASPGILRMILGSLGREDSPFLVRPGALPGLLGWGVRFLRQCTANAWLRNTNTIFRLCRYSKTKLNELVEETGIDYDANHRGTLHLFRDEASIAGTRHVARTLGEIGLSHEILDAGGCIELEPALAAQRGSISGGIYYPDDEAGDAHLFTQRLAHHCAGNDVEFRHAETVRTLDVRDGRLIGVVTDKGRVPADACVVALGNGSASLLRPFRIRLPIYPVKGYSITFPVGSWNGAPMVPLADGTRKVGVVRIGDRIRVAGTAEFTGYDASLNSDRIENLRRYFSESFPGYPSPSAGKAWTGLRPMTPDGIPYLGRTPIRGLYLNTGHGHLGWTMSCGSAQAVANLVNGRNGDLDLSHMTLENRI